MRIHHQDPTHIEPQRSANEAPRLHSTIADLPCGIVMLDAGGAVCEANAQALAMLGMPLPHGLVFAVTLGEWFRIPEVLYAADFERGFHLRVEDRTLWLQSGSTDSYGGTTIAITDVTRFASAVDERESSLRFLLHDLRSPLNSISALTQLDASDPEAFEQCGGMQQITQLAHYVLSLGEQFIFNSVAEHLLARDFRRFDLRATLRQIVSQLEVTAVYCGVPLHLWMPDSASVWVSGMRNFAARAIQNLIDNAVRASRRGEPVAVSLRHAGQFVEVHVSDRAGGLPGLADGERLTHFDQLGKKTATGFGLGLKLAVQIVELHGGSLYAERNDDGGTLFVLRLPCLNTVRQGRAPLPLDEADRVLRAARR